jgi:hypothetical protein
MTKKILLIVFIFYLISGIIYAQNNENANPFIGKWIMKKDMSIHHVYTANRITAYLDGYAMWTARYIYDNEKITFKRQSNTPYGIQEYDQVCKYLFSEDKLVLDLEGWSEFDKDTGD